MDLKENIKGVSMVNIKSKNESKPPGFKEIIFSLASLLTNRQIMLVFYLANMHTKSSCNVSNYYNVCLSWLSKAP